MLYIAVPVMNELELFPQFLNAVAHQKTAADITLYVCVNQPESFWNRPDKVEICHNNAAVIELLKTFTFCPIELIDRSSKGYGWSEKQQGVGWARKLLMDAIGAIAEEGDLIVSLDADTDFSPNYLEAIRTTFTKQNRAVALAVPYYHRLTDSENENRAMLRYECYMRYYAIQMFRIKNPYAFTALGSAIVLPVSAYRAIRGVKPRPSGEDFYLLQKLTKYGSITHSCKENVYPATRFSDRVPFGTGPAMLKGVHGDWKSYPFYPTHYFSEIGATTALFPILYETDIATPIDDFLDKMGMKNCWQPLRQNAKTTAQFVKACHQKIDGLRWLQFLRYRAEDQNQEDELANVKELLALEGLSELPQDFTFSTAPIAQINALRDQLFALEEKYRASTEKQ